MNEQARTIRPPVQAATLTPGGHAGMVVGLLLVATFFGLVGGMLGFQIQFVLTLAVVALLAVLGSQKLAIAVFLVVMMFHPTPYYPRVIQNLVIFGIPLLFLARIWLRMMTSREAHVPMPNELLAYVALMFIAVAIGYTHLHEIPEIVVVSQSTSRYGFKEYVLGFFAKQMMLVAMAVIIGSLVIDKRGGRWMVAIALGASALYVVAMLFLLASGGIGLNQLGTSRRLFEALGRHSNQVGYAMVIALAMALFVREGLKGGWRLAATLTIGLMVAGVLMSASRGAAVGMIVVFAVYCITYRRAGAFLTAMLVLVAGFALAPQPVQDRLLKGLDDKRSAFAVSLAPSDELTSGRLDIWRQVAPEVLDNPVIGNGLRGTMWSKYNRHGSGFKVLHPHSLYLSSLMDVGLIGTFIVGMMYWFFLRQSRRLAADPRVGTVMQNFFRAGPAILLAMLALGLANGHAYPAPEQMNVWIFFGIVLGYMRLYPPPKAEPAKRSAARRPPVMPAAVAPAMAPRRGSWQR